MRYLRLGEVIALHERIIAATGGAGGIRDLGRLEAALQHPQAGFGGRELYPGVVDKAVALTFALVMGHPFVDGNKRTGHAAMETFLVLNGYEIEAPVKEQERMILALAAGECSRDDFLAWAGLRTVPLQGPDHLKRK